MAINFPPISSAKPPYRVLSMDGGGIYGLSTAILLRMLCEKDKKFLSKDEPITLFAGSSAGALIALNLAKSDNPRDVVLNGDLEDFFKNPLVYSNALNPVTAMTSLMGLTAWGGTPDYLVVLEKHFKDLTLGDLKQRVLITSFNYNDPAGKDKDHRHWKPKLYYNFPDNEEDRSLKVVDVAYGASSPAAYRKIMEGATDGGLFAPNPSVNALAKVIEQGRETEMLLKAVNLLVSLNDFHLGLLTLLATEVFDDLIVKDDDKHLEYFIKEYNALKEAFKEEDKQLMTQVVELLRAEAKFFKKGGEFEELSRKDKLKKGFEVLTSTFIPALNVIASILPAVEISEKVQKENQILIKDLTKTFETAREKIIKELNKGDASPGPIEEIVSCYLHQNNFLEKVKPDPIKSLKDLSVLSLGVCSRAPYYFTPDFDLGAMPFNMIPTNFFNGDIYPPIVSIFLDAPSEETNFEMKQLLGNAGYRRLSPPVVKFPTPPVIPALYMARWPILKNWIVALIEAQVQGDHTKVVDAAVNETITWLEEERWRNPGRHPHKH